MLKQKFAVSLAVAAIAATSLTFPALAANKPDIQTDSPKAAGYTSNPLENAGNTNKQQGKFKKDADGLQTITTEDGITLTVSHSISSGKRNLPLELKTDEDGMQYFTTEEGVVISFTTK